MLRDQEEHDLAIGTLPRAIPFASSDDIGGFALAALGLDFRFHADAP